MHKEPKSPINIEVLADGKAFVPHETKAPGNALPCTAKRNRGGKKVETREVCGEVGARQKRIRTKRGYCAKRCIRKESGGAGIVRRIA